jgi:hypothetical protein
MILLNAKEPSEVKLVIFVGANIYLCKTNGSHALPGLFIFVHKVMTRGTSPSKPMNSEAYLSNIRDWPGVRIMTALYIDK